MPGRDLKGPATTNTISQYVTVFEVTGGNIAARGWYLYNGPWNEDVVSQGNFSNFQQTYANQPFSAPQDPILSYNGTFVNYLVNGMDQGASFGVGQQGGGIIKEGNNMTILGGSTTSNLAFPNTGARLIRSGSEAAAIAEWRIKCKYILNRGFQPGEKGIYAEGASTSIPNDAATAALWLISQGDVDDFRWQVQL